MPEPTLELQSDSNSITGAYNPSSIILPTWGGVFISGKNTTCHQVIITPQTPSGPTTIQGRRPAFHEALGWPSAPGS